MPATPRPSRRSAPAPRAWQRMLSGRKLDLLNPVAVDIEIEDIAHGLARVARWNGQTVGDHPFSVAQHSLVVLDILAVTTPNLDASARLYALLHDAPEFVIGDMISPFKAALGLDYRAFEDRLACAIHARFTLPAYPPVAVKTAIKKADIMSAWLEATQLAKFELEEANRFFKKPPDAALFTLEPMPAAAAQRAYLDAFASLIDEV